MEKRPIVLLLALMIPLALYGIPYAYAAGTKSTYLVRADVAVAAGGETVTLVMCSSPSDFTLHENAPFTSLRIHPNDIIIEASWVNSGGVTPSTGDIPNGWRFLTDNPDIGSVTFPVFIACQSPVTVAGIGVPEFGSLYFAIALGAIVYFIMARRFAKGPTMSAQVKA